VVPELRDYHQINTQLVRRLNLGQTHIRLESVAGQRLLASRLSGPWKAVIEVDGDAGPELAAELDAPGLLVVCRGNAADGAGSSLAAGQLLVLGNCCVALGYFQKGGLIVCRGDAAPRAGLNQRGGELVLLGRFGALTGERQSGGRLFLPTDNSAPHVSFSARGGRVVRFPLQGDTEAGSAQPAGDDAQVLQQALDLVVRYGSSG
jgi:glutamate synthase domain-containing protein 3